jgi:Phosphoesterase family
MSHPLRTVRFARHRTVLIAAGVIALVGATIVTLQARALAPVNLRGVVSGVFFVPPAGSTPPSTASSYYRGAKVCVDLDDNGVCDAGEPSATTDIAGQFFLRAPASGPLLADVTTTALNNGVTVDKHVVFRASVEAIAEGLTGAGPLAAANVVIGPLSTEIGRMMAADSLTYSQAKQNLAQRLGAAAGQVVGDLNKLADSPTRQALLRECVILSNRFTLATKMVDRGDVSPAALAMNPSATSPVISPKEAQEASMNLEGIPRYDNIFIIILENKATASIKNSIYAPLISQYLRDGNQLTSYFANGNPSEPNRIGVSSGDDWGVTDDSGWNCVPVGDTADAVEEPLPAGLGACTNATNHNLKKPNLFSAMTHAGMSWRIYSESMNPGRDWRLNGANDSTVLAPDHLYDGTAPGVVAGIGTPGLMLTFSGSLYQTKHNGSVSFQDVRKEWDFAASNRTMGGGQWDDALRAKAVAGWDVDQLSTDLASGDVGNLNFLEPDQCDDMHGTTISGRVGGVGPTITGSDCDGGNKNIFRGDLYTDALIKKIQASALWQNPTKRVAIVISFDEATATTGFNSCCGWNPAGKPGRTGSGTVQGPLILDNTNHAAVDPTVARYANGNKGHGTSIFGILTNQAGAPKGVVDSDAYSHISFVRTLQDMFGIADPGDDWSYMNRSKYTEKFIADHLDLLPEYSGSADTHFDSVRPMNHRYVIPVDYAQKSGFLTPPGPQVGPDLSQLNVWAIR